MKILVCNPGSTSLKFRLSEEPEGKVIAGGKIGRVGSERAEYAFTMGEKTSSGVRPIGSYVEGIGLFLSFIGGAEQADAVAFKTVLAKGVSGVVEITDEVTAAMRDYLAAAPVHNTAYLSAIEAFRSIAPCKKLIGCFETAFHETIPPERYLYSVPYEWYERYGVRRMGFHGASHEGVAEATKGYRRVVSCHLGGSGSVCAILDGKSVDTSFGFSLQAGLPHVDRCGDIDPYLQHFLTSSGMSEAEYMNGIEKNGGLKGISGLSGDMRDLREAAKNGHERAKLAIGVYTTQIVRYIGAFAAELHGIDALAFTGGIGENDWETRAEVCENLGFLGIRPDGKKNRANLPRIEEAGSVPVFIVKADEEATVARKAWKFLA